jgi:anti-sigma-K factor RskA
MSAPEDMSDREGLAAEYVLGTLPLPERLEAERLIASDADFASLVADWATRLAPLNDEIAEIAPPSDLLPKIEARLFPKARPAPRWRWPLMGAIAATAAALAFFWIAPILQPHDVRTATLVGENQPLVIQAAFDATDHELTFTRQAGPAADSGKDYELGIIPEGQPAVSLGVLGDTPHSVALADLPPGTTLAVTLEQTGGSPTGVAQGPLLVATVISDI